MRLYLKKHVESFSLVLLLAIVFVGMIGPILDKYTPLSFDEGWSLVVARNWIEQGKYAIQQIGEWVSSAPMTQSFSLTVPLAASFRLFGVGIPSGRLPDILFTVLSLALIFGLARKLYGAVTAWVTLFVLLCLSTHPFINPAVFGRQVLGEPPMLFFLLLGYWFLIKALQGSTKSLVMVGLCWGLALITKKQALPFWAASVLVPLVIAIFRRDKQVIRIILVVMLATGAAMACFSFVESIIVGSWPPNGQFNMQGLYNLAVWTWTPEVRLAALRTLVIFCFAPLVALPAAALRLVQRLRRAQTLDAGFWCELSFFSLAGTWFVWFVFGSLAWLRYYYPVFVLSSVFFAKLITDWTGKLRQWPTPDILKNDPSRFTKTLAVSVLILLSLGVGVISFGLASKQTVSGVLQVADYFHNKVDRGALVETYESELFFLLDQPIHYPPDQLQIELNRRVFLREPVTIAYNPLLANPKYLVVGSSEDLWHLYEPILQAGSFSLVQAYPGYRIYKRVN